MITVQMYMCDGRVDLSYRVITLSNLTFNTIYHHVDRGLPTAPAHWQNV